MPTYDYRCLSCGYTFEHFQSMSSRPLTQCPECGKKLEKLLSGGAGVIFKGSGFYQTDYKPEASAGKGKQAPVCGSGQCRQPDVCGSGQNS